MIIQDKLKSIIEDNSYLIDAYKFTDFYNKINDGEYRSKITTLLFKEGINPLNYMEEIPQFFLIDNESTKDIEFIFIPSNIKKFRKCSIIGRSLADIYFGGNINQWQSIIKELDWLISDVPIRVHFKNSKDTLIL